MASSPRRRRGLRLGFVVGKRDDPYTSGAWLHRLPPARERARAALQSDVAVAEWIRCHGGAAVDRVVVYRPSRGFLLPALCSKQPAPKL